jgi:thioesterase domain-containing protein/acyl carrier protein
VVAVDEPTGGRALVAYVVGAGRAPDTAALRAFLSERLPSAFVPAAIVPLDALPLTPSGKLDRRALPAPHAPRERRAATPARGPLKRELAAVWSELLGVSEVGVDDDFFELGGHSLLAVRMLQRIEQLYGVPLPLAALHTEPTIDGIAAALLRHDAATAPAPIVRIRAGDGAAPVFFFHGDLNGGGFYCRKLARRLPAGRAVWTVPPLGTDGRPVPLSIEAMARQHVQDLVAVAPAGPVVLGGYCNGGLVAWEAARLLTAAGRRVERVILVAADADTRFAGLRAPLTSAARLLGASRASAVIQFGRLRFFASRLRALSARQRAGLAVRGAARLVAQVARRVRRPAGRAAGPAPPRALGRYFDLVRSYVPGPWPGDVVVLWPADEPPRRPGDPTLGWGALARRVDAYVLPGDHDEIVTRHIDRVAELLRPYL